jgi:hypothetical protein
MPLPTLVRSIHILSYRIIHRHNTRGEIPRSLLGIFFWEVSKMKTVDGQTIVVSIQAIKAIKEKYNLQADGDDQIKFWMVEEMVAWDQANGTTPQPTTGSTEWYVIHAWQR